MMTAREQLAMGEPIQVVVARGALLEVGMDKAAKLIYANKIGAPSITGGVDCWAPRDQIAIITAIVMGHRAADHDAQLWIQIKGPVIGATCKDCMKLSEDRQRAGDTSDMYAHLRSMPMLWQGE